MKTLLILSLLFAWPVFAGSLSEDSSWIPIYMKSRSAEKAYKDFCAKYDRNNSCCDAVDVSCSPFREAWIYFPHGINFCEESYVPARAINVFKDGHLKQYYPDKDHDNKYAVYCVGVPDPVTKEVYIGECPDKWSEDAGFLLAEGHPLNPKKNWYSNQRHFTDLGISDFIIGVYGLGKYSVILHAIRSMVNWKPEQIRTFKINNGVDYRDIKTMVCRYYKSPKTTK